MSKRSTLDAFIRPSKKAKAEVSETAADKDEDAAPRTSSKHETYPFAVPDLPPSIRRDLDCSPAAEGRVVDNKPDLDLIYYAPFINAATAKQLFHLLRSELFFYRVQYMIKRGSVETAINTPRYTTVFGVDSTSTFRPTAVAGSAPESGQLHLYEADTGKRIAPSKYSCKPRPIPDMLDVLRRVTEALTGETFNFCLVNYYASGNDSISYHSDDERFLGNNPAIASFSLGGKRDFLMRHKPVSANATLSDREREVIEEAAAKPLKLPLASGDMVLMRASTQSCWLHSIPKRKGGEADSIGRINITFRKALAKGGTENYYKYNVGAGPPFKWDQQKREMAVWKER